DIAKVQGKISSVAADIASATGISTTLAMGDSINTIGGAILKTQSGDIEINNTIEARLDRFKKVLRSEVANVLFN
ncbi:MAG: V-type proton ATPase subunit E, partial [Methanobrevibacter woesei]|nr:V-type proton ATPase subunit E [Methanobrevibacter woesei]